MSYTGVYDRTIFYNPPSKYCVISVKTSDQSIPKQARSAYRHRDHLIRFTAVGYELPQTDQVSMILDGEWQSEKYGQQLQVSRCPRGRTRRSIWSFAITCLLSRILPVQARRRCFGWFTVR